MVWGERGAHTTGAGGGGGGSGSGKGRGGGVGAAYRVTRRRRAWSHLLFRRPRVNLTHELPSGGGGRAVGVCSLLLLPRLLLLRRPTTAGHRSSAASHASSRALLLHAPSPPPPPSQRWTLREERAAQERPHGDNDESVRPAAAARTPRARPRRCGPRVSKEQGRGVASSE